jgi:TolA-binding protein
MFKFLILGIWAVTTFFSFKIKSHHYIESEIRKASTLIKEERYIEAIDIYDKLLSFKSRWVDESKLPENLTEKLLGNKANCLSRLGKYEEARKIYEQLLKSETQAVQATAQYELGESYFRNKKYEEAIEAYRVVIEKFPTETERVKKAMFKTALSYKFLNNSAAAIDAFRELENAFWESEYAPDARYEILTCLFNEGDYESVVYEYTPYEKDERYARSRYADDATLMLAQSLEALEEYEEARRRYQSLLEKVEEVSPRIKERASLGVASCTLELGDAKGALELLTKIEQEYPQGEAKVELQLIRARVYQRLNQFKEAEGEFKSVLENYPEHKLRPRALYGLGELYLTRAPQRRDYYLKALKVLKEIPEETEVYPPARVKIIEIYKALDIKEALRECQGVIKSSASVEIKAQAQLDLAEIYFGRKDFHQAKKEFEKLTKDYPKSTRVHIAKVGIGRCLYRLGKYSEALTFYDELLKDYTQALEKEELSKEKREALEAAKENIYYQQSACYEAQGEVTKAVEILEKIVKEKGRLAGKAELRKFEILQRHQPEEAIKMYRERIESEELSESERLDYLFTLGNFLLTLKRYQSAREVFLEFQEKAPEHERTDEVMYQLALCDYELKEYERARDGFIKIVKEFPNSHLIDKAIKSLVICYKLQGFKLEEIISKLQALQLTGEAALTAKLESGKLYQDEGKYQKARECYNEVSEETTDFRVKAEVTYQIGKLFMKQGKYPEAIQYFEKVLSEYETSQWVEPAKFDLAQSLEMTNQLQRAKEFYDHHITARTRYREKALFRKGKIYTLEGDPKRAEECFQEIISSSTSEKTKATARFALAKLYYIYHRFEASAKVLEEFLEKAPLPEYEEEAIRCLGEAYYNLEEFEKASLAYEKFVKKFPRSGLLPSVILSLGHSYEKMGEMEKAIGAFKKLQQKFPYHSLSPRAQLIIGNIYYNNGKYENAISEYKTVLKRYPKASVEVAKAKQSIKDSREILAERVLKKAEKIYTLKEYEKALEKFQKVIEDYPETLMAINAKAYIGSCYEHLREYPQALKVYQEIIKVYGDNPEAARIVEFIKSRVKEIEEERAFGEFE